jgi:hypothetical protein
VPHVTTTYERATLYEEVWKEPVTTVSKRYGVSDVALRKVCKRLAVPLPPVGYWTRVKHGRVPPRPSVSRFKGEEKYVVRRYVPEHHDPEPPAPKPKEVLAQEAFEGQPENRIEVPRDLRGAHPIVSATALLEREKGRPGLSPDFWELQKKTLDLRVSKPSRRRALLLAQAVLKGAEQRGFRAGQSRDKDRGPVIEVLGEEIALRIRERTRRIEREWTQEELRKRRLDPTYRPVGLYEHVPSGAFVMEFFTDRGSWVAGEIKDEKGAPLESKLNRVMVKLVALAVERKEQKEEERQRQLREAAEQQRRWEEEARRQKEEKRRKCLLDQIESWRRAKGIREFVSLVETKLRAAEFREEQEGRIAKWISWARAAADELDPLQSGLVLDLVPESL